MARVYAIAKPGPAAGTEADGAQQLSLIYSSCSVASSGHAAAVARERPGPGRLLSSLSMMGRI